MNPTYTGIVSGTAWRIWIAVWVSLLCAQAGFAQSPVGTISGAVTDQSGAAIARAQLALVEEATGLSRSSETNAEGIYRFPFLSPGTYTLTAEASGFAPYKNVHITIVSRQALQIDVPMKVGELAVDVEVTSAVPAINTDNGTISENLSRRLLTEGPQGTPIMGGVSNNIGKYSVLVRDGGIGAEDFKASGSRSGDFNMTVDGNPVVLNASVNLAIPYQALQGAEITTVGAPAEYRTPLTITNVTRGGTNKFQGSFTQEVSFPRLNALPAMSLPGTRRPNIKAVDGGFNVTAGGPAFVPRLYNGRDRSFWFATLDRLPSTDNFSAMGLTLGVPTNAMRSGNFQPYFNVTNPAKVLRNPYTGLPFPGNAIPASMFNPAAVKILARFLAAPTVTNTELPFQNYLGPVGSSLSNRALFLRFDHKITQSNTAGFTFTSSPYDSQSTNAFPTNLGNNVLLGRAKQYSWSDVHIFSSRIVNEARFAMYRGFNGRHSNDGGTLGGAADAMGIDLGADAAFRSPYLQLPLIRVTGYQFDASQNFIGGVYAWDQREQYWTHIWDNLSIQMGKHAFKIGYDEQRKMDARPPSGANIGSGQQYSGAYTGDPFADFLLGLPASTTRDTATLARNDKRSRDLAFYFQDGYRIRNGLTVNMGLRFEHWFPYKEASGAYNSFSPAHKALVLPNQASIALIPPAFPSSIPRITAAEAGYPETLVKPVNSWQPRLSFAYKPFPDRDVVLRGAYSVFSTMAGNVNNSFRLLAGDPFGTREVLFNPSPAAMAGGARPLVTLDQPFPGSLATLPATIGASGANPDIGLPVMQQYTVSLESRLVGGWVGTLSYNGSKTTGLWWTRNLARPQPGLTPYNDAAMNPYYPYFGSVSWVDKGGTATFNGLQARLRHNYRSGLEFDGMFQWSSEITDIWDDGFNSLRGAPENPYCLTCYRVKNPFTNSLDFRAITRYELPFGRGKQFLSGANRIVNAAVSNWSLSAIIDIRNGRPGSVTYSGTDRSNTNLRGGYAKVLPGCDVYGSTTPNAYLNINCFAPPDLGTFGNALPGVFRGPGAWNVNMAAYRYIPAFRDRLKFRLSCVVNNIFNHPVWFGYNSNISAPASFGKYERQGNVTTATGPRSLVFQSQVTW